MHYRRRLLMRVLVSTASAAVPITGLGIGPDEVLLSSVRPLR